MITRTKRLLRIGEVYFDEQPTNQPVDIVRYNQAPVPLDNTDCKDFWTIILVLTEGVEFLFSRLKKDTRNEVRRSMKDKLQYMLWNIANGDQLIQFVDFYDRFAATKSLPKANKARLAAIAQIGALSLSRVSTNEGEVLTWHAYYRCQHRVRLIHSASLHKAQITPTGRSLVGRANRFHHWSDIIEFKKEGITICDLGGWYQGTEDVDKLRINAFKEEFGGTVVREYTCLQGITIAGRAALLALRVMAPFERLRRELT